MNVRVIIEKQGDQGYEHFDEIIPIELIPKEGEVIELYYPDGGVIQIKKVLSVYKSFTNREVVIMVKVVEIESDDYLGKC